MRLRRFRILVALVTVLVAVGQTMLPNPAASAYSDTVTFINAQFSAYTTTITTPTYAPGDVFILGINVTSSATITPPTGFTKIREDTGSGSCGVLCTANEDDAIYWHRAGSSEPSSYSYTVSGAGGGWAAAIASYRNVDSVSANPYNAQNGATGTSTAASVSLTTVATNSMLVGFFGSRAAITVGGGLTDEGGANGGPVGNTAYCRLGHKTVATPGSATASASIASSNLWAAQAVALTPASPVLALSGYRWYDNQNSLKRDINEDISSGDDSARGMAADPASDALYIDGYYSTGSEVGWRIEKRKLSDSSLITAFGTGGYINENPTANADATESIAIDTAGGAMYVVGYDSPSSTDKEWRIEKRDLTTGALVSGFGTGGVVTENPSTANDLAWRVVLDASSGTFGVFGFDSNTSDSTSEWRAEKRSMTTGALVSGFGTGGVMTEDPTPASSSDGAASMALDAAGGYLYLGGIDANGSGSQDQLRVEKRSWTTGALVSGFGTGGVVNSDPSTGDDGVNGLVLDTSAGAIYALGYDSINGAADPEARIEKRDTSTGALISGWGSSGVVTSNQSSALDSYYFGDKDSTYLYAAGPSNPGSQQAWLIEKFKLSDGTRDSNFGSSGTIMSTPNGNNLPQNILADSTNGNLYVSGYDTSATSGSSEWHIEKRSTATGDMDLSPIAAQNTAAVLTAANQVRLRYLVYNSGGTLMANDQQFKLQYAQRSGTCDAGFVGETYQDVQSAGSGSSGWRYYDNPLPADGAAITSNGTALTHGTDTVLGEDYVESSPYSNPTALNVSQDGLWDLSLENLSTNSAYCFRVVRSDGTLLDSYSVIPELTVCSFPSPDDQMRHGAYFCNGGKQNTFYWSK